MPWWRHVAPPDLCVAILLLADTLLALSPRYVLTEPDRALLLLVGAGTSDYPDALSARKASTRNSPTS